MERYENGMLVWRGTLTVNGVTYVREDHAEEEIAELEAMLEEALFFVLNPDHPVTVTKRAWLQSVKDERPNNLLEEWREYLRREVEQSREEHDAQG